jgi:hypothetical protein
MTDAFAKLVSGMQAGAAWDLMGQTESVKSLLEGVFDERIHRLVVRSPVRRRDDGVE